MSSFHGRTFQIFRTNYGDPLWRESVSLQREVYCDERHYEDRPDCQNLDCFDAYDQNQAQRIVVMTGHSVIATTRLLTAGDKALPAFRLRPELKEVAPDSSGVEVSSFCCSKSLRMRHGLQTAEASRSITFLLLAGVIALAEELREELVLLTVERALYRYICSLGFPLYRAGKPVSYHGLRQVCYGYLNSELVPGVLLKSRSEWLAATDHAPLAQLLTREDEAVENRRAA